MNYFITGTSGSGKSAAAERLALTADQIPLYIGTLPRNEMTLARIHAHEARRNDTWTLLETTLAWNCIRGELFKQIDYHTSILLDGLSSMLWLQSYTYGARSSDLENIVRDLHKILEKKARTESQVIIVDSSVPFPKLGQNFWFNALMQEIHAKFTVSTQWQRVQTKPTKAS